MPTLTRSYRTAPGRAAVPMLYRPLSEWERLQLQLRAAQHRQRAREDDDELRARAPRKKAKGKGGKKKTKPAPNPFASKSLTKPAPMLTKNEAPMTSELRKRGKKKQSKTKLYGKAKKVLYGCPDYTSSVVKPVFSKNSAPVAVDTRTSATYAAPVLTAADVLPGIEDAALRRLLANDPELMDQFTRKKASAYGSNIIKPGKGKKSRKGKGKGTKVNPFTPKSASKGPTIPSTVGALKVQAA